jgi:hypothetical protein
MRFPRVRFTLRSIMVIVALTGMLMAALIDQSRGGRRLVDFEDVRYIKSKPLVNPTKVRAIDRARITEDGFVQLLVNSRIALEDGRIVLIEDRPFRVDEQALDDLSQSEWFVEVQTQADGSATVYAKEPVWFYLNRREALIHIPIFRRDVYTDRKLLVGTGRIIEGAASLSMGDRRGAAR